MNCAVNGSWMERRTIGCGKTVQYAQYNETVDNKWDPHDDVLTGADMLEIFNSNSEDEERLS